MMAKQYVDTLNTYANEIVTKLRLIKEVEIPTTYHLHIMTKGLCYLKQYLSTGHISFYKITIHWLKELLEMKQKLMKNNMLELFSVHLTGITTELCQLVLTNSNLHSFLYEVFRLWSQLITSIPNTYRAEAIKINKQYFCRFASELLQTVGNFNIQIWIIEILMRYLVFSSDYRKAIIGDLFNSTCMNEVRERFLHLNFNNFDEQFRMFLNEYNLAVNNRSVCSLPVKMGWINEYQIAAPKTRSSTKKSFWIDLNKNSPSISFILDPSTFSNIIESNWIQVEILINSISKINFSSVTGNLCVEISLISPPIVYQETNYQTLKSACQFKFIFHKYKAAFVEEKFRWLFDSHTCLFKWTLLDDDLKLLENTSVQREKLLVKTPRNRRRMKIKKNFKILANISETEDDVESLEVDSGFNSIPSDSSSRKTLRDITNITPEITSLKVFEVRKESLVVKSGKHKLNADFSKLLEMIPKV